MSHRSAPDAAVAHGARGTDLESAQANAPTYDGFERDLDALLAIEPRVAWAALPPAAAVRWADVWTMRVLVAGGVTAIAAFLVWFFGENHVGTPWLYGPMTAVLVFFLLLTLYEWFCYLGVRPRAETPPPGDLTVDIFTTWCPGEPREMVVSTLKSIQRIRYPHTTYLCDEGDDPLLRAVCERLGVQHVTREQKVGAKAGNINNALRRASGDIAVVLDPDHEPGPFFLDRVLGYFRDPAVGFVQCVQGYYNQSESVVARGAAEQSYHFYGPMMIGMHTHGTTQAIGANCAFRRAALDSIGGHATGLAEDMATTLELYALGWRSVYVPEMLTRGLTPNTLGAFSKQQLKWACGVWDILIESLPGAWRKLGWANRLHFLHNGLFFSRGLFVAVGIAIPIIALVTGQVPWRIELVEFVQWFGPVLAAQILIRQTAQRWLIEPAERGFHLVGGFLMNATWWVHLAGMVSSLRRVRIPYIPTPKDDEAADAWGLAAPNIVLAAASFVAVAYGLDRDWSPFALLMAVFALINGVVLSFVAVSGQQKTLQRLRLARPGPQRPRPPARGLLAALYWILRRQALLLALPLAALAVGAGMVNSNAAHHARLSAAAEARADRDAGGFLLGLYVAAMDEATWGQRPIESAIDEIAAVETALETQFTVVSLYHQWGDAAVERFPAAELAAIRARGAVPMITWEPTLAQFDWAADFPDTAADRKVFQLIADGKMDYFLDAYAARIRAYGGPVLMRFAHEMDNPQYPWSARGGNTPQEFIAAWRYVVEYFEGMGATNVAWVWSPWQHQAFEAYYPGSDYVDWIGLTLLNYGVHEGAGSWQSFASLYAPFEAWGEKLGKPVLLAEFGSTGKGGDQQAWLVDALAQLRTRPEIRGAIFFDNHLDRNWPAAWNAAPDSPVIDWRIDPAAPALREAVDALLAARTPYPPAPQAGAIARAAGPNRVARVDGGWSLTSGGEPFFIRGVAYGAGHGWRTVNEPTRTTVDADFAAIAAMGANTIRRYHPHWGDRNILRAAKAHDLKVLAGFWLAADADYLTDAGHLDALESEVLEMVQRMKDDPSVLMWVIGNEVWGLMKHAHTQPRLTEMRQAYMRFLERVARSIKDIDPTRPVATAFEATQELPGALADLERFAPSVDVIGINAYYASHLSRLNHTVHVFGGGRPWFLSEFGPDGYWETYQTNWSATGLALEPDDSEKAAQYVARWQTYVEGNRPWTLGGVAFSWSDRLEGSTTWFGLTDFEGRKKPAYYALKDVWTGRASPDVSTAAALALSADAERVASGDPLTLRLGAVRGPPDCEIVIELVADVTFERSERARVACRDADIAVDAPRRAGRYRFVARMLIGEDATVTASVPLLVQ